MKMLNPLLLVILLIPLIAAAQELTWAELASRPELWPAQCTVKTTIHIGTLLAAAKNPTDKQ
jgi:hypothetical protein